MHFLNPNPYRFEEGNRQLIQKQKSSTKYQGLSMSSCAIKRAQEKITQII